MKSGEIDIIAVDPAGESRDFSIPPSDTIVFCEVKYRKSEEYGRPEQAVNKAKQRTISRVADHFIAQNGLTEDMAYRFDVIAVTEHNGKTDDIRWLRNAFSYVPRR